MCDNPDMTVAELLMPFEKVRPHPDAFVFWAKCRLCQREDGLLISIRPFRATCRNACKRMGILKDAFAGRRLTPKTRLEVMDAARAAAKNLSEDSREIERLTRWLR